MHGSCENALAHYCFSKFNEKLHVIAVDNNMVVTMRKLKYFYLMCISVVIYRTTQYNIQGDAFNLRHSNISKNKHTTKKC